MKALLEKGQASTKELGYDPKPKKKKRNKRKKRTNVQGQANKPIGPTHGNFAGKNNPSYVLLKTHDGHVYAKYVGTSYTHDYFWSIWVPKTLVTNKRGPIAKWVPKTKA